MQVLLQRAKEEEDFFWLSMGFFSSDGEMDEDYNSRDNFDSDG